MKHLLRTCFVTQELSYNSKWGHPTPRFYETSFQTVSLLKLVKKQVQTTTNGLFNSLSQNVNIHSDEVWEFVVLPED